MLKNKLNSSFYKKKSSKKECYAKTLHIIFKLAKKIILLLVIAPNIFDPAFELRAESQGREIQIYVKSGSTLQAKKRKEYENSQKESGLKIKRYLINKSALQSKKGKSYAARQKMVESGFLTLEMIKNNKWFVKKSAESLYSKSKDYEKSKNISRNALRISKNRARITGPVKPDHLFAESSSRDAMIMTRTRARFSGPVKPGIIYAEDIGRKAKKISITRAVVTGPVKPKRLYSEQVSRDAKKISINTAKEYITTRRDMSVYSDVIESMSKRPTLNDKPVNVEDYENK